jgi:hypothetical protein
MNAVFLAEAHQVLAKIADQTLWELTPEQLQALSEYAFPLLPLDLMRKAFEKTRVSFEPQLFQSDNAASVEQFMPTRDLVREIRQTSVNPGYQLNHAESREYFLKALKNKAYETLSGFITMMNESHDLACRGTTGDRFYYQGDNEAVNLINTRPGTPRSPQNFPGAGNMPPEAAQDVEAVAKQYRDPFRLNQTEPHAVQLAGIEMSNLPTNTGSNHAYPLDTVPYFEQMQRTLTALQHLPATASYADRIEKIGQYFQYAANGRFYAQINNSLYMNQVNALLKENGLQGIPHLNLDFLAHRLQPEVFRQYFYDTVMHYQV